MAQDADDEEAEEAEAEADIEEYIKDRQSIDIDLDDAMAKDGDYGKGERA